MNKDSISQQRNWGVVIVLNSRDAWLRDSGRYTWLTDTNRGKRRKVGANY
jgi:hypothetical protein